MFWVEHWYRVLKRLLANTIAVFVSTHPLSSLELHGYYVLFVKDNIVHKYPATCLHLKCLFGITGLDVRACVCYCHARRVGRTPDKVIIERKLR